MFEEIYGYFNNAYHSDSRGTPFYDYRPRRLHSEDMFIYYYQDEDRSGGALIVIEKKPYYSIEEIKEYRDYYVRELVVNLYRCLRQYYWHMPKLADIIDEICSLDRDVLNEKLLETERLYYAEASMVLKEDDLKQNLRQINIFREILETHNEQIHNPKEELCKIIIENNEYLRKKIKVKGSYADALYSYYTRHR